MIWFTDSSIISRWEHADAKMRANLLAFSSGARSCVGQKFVLPNNLRGNLLMGISLATMQMKIHMGMILRKYRIKGHPDTTPYSMEPLDFFQGKPRAGKCLLYFEMDE
jgi:hypothetical protein